MNSGKISETKSDRKGSVYFGPLQAPYFRNVNWMGLSTNPLICMLIDYNKL